VTFCAASFVPSGSLHGLRMECATPGPVHAGNVHPAFTLRGDRLARRPAEWGLSVRPDRTTSAYSPRPRKMEGEGGSPRCRSRRLPCGSPPALRNPRPRDNLCLKRSPPSRARPLVVLPAGEADQERATQVTSAGTSPDPVPESSETVRVASEANRMPPGASGPRSGNRPSVDHAEHPCYHDSTAWRRSDPSCWRQSDTVSRERRLARSLRRGAARGMRSRLACRNPRTRTGMGLALRERWGARLRITMPGMHFFLGASRWLRRGSAQSRCGEEKRGGRTDR
jgi:hypothetical protein